jgi:hypothetical protein
MHQLDAIAKSSYRVAVRKIPQAPREHRVEMYAYANGTYEVKLINGRLRVAQGNECYGYDDWEPM